MKFAVVGFAACVLAADVSLENFAEPAHQWKENNDPVMGGKSVGTTSFNDGALVFNGTVVDVPSLQAPGFITTRSDDQKVWADVSNCKSLKLTVKSLTDYAGYRVSFGKARALVCGKFFAYGYKAPFTAPIGQFGDVVIPFSSFSDCWDDSTGDLIHTCEDNHKFCPTAKALSNLGTVSIWGEGVGGDVHLEVKEISGADCS